MKQFLVEVFVPRSRAGELSAANERVREATSRIAGGDCDIRYVQTIYVPDDETCFYVFNSSSADLVAQVSGMAGLEDGRIVETLGDSKGGRR